jgi:putative transposase
VRDLSERPKGYRFPMTIIKYAVWLYHRFTLSFRDVQEILFERGIDISHETIRAWCGRFGPAIAEELRDREPRRGRTWHVDEMRLVLGGVVHWLWRAVNEHGDVLDVLLQEKRGANAAKRFFRRLLDHHDIPEELVSDGLESYGAALREVPELTAVEHIEVLASEHRNNLIEQSHRPTRDQERQQRCFRGAKRAQGFLFTLAHVSNLVRHTRARTLAEQRRHNWLCAFAVWDEVALQVA